ncbi:hypothetical protein AMTRI_Chr09g12290 [Amborella trichopoda]
MMQKAIGRGALLGRGASASSYSLSSPSASTRVYIDISHAVRGPTRWRGRSFAASVPSDSPKHQKGQKVSKAERRTMLESFVQQYRASNAGKFPTASFAKKNVGGSYYTIRRILQELEYESKKPHVISEKENFLENAQRVIENNSEAKEEILISTHFEEVIRPTCMPSDRSLREEHDSASEVLPSYYEEKRVSGKRDTSERRELSEVSRGGSTSQDFSSHQYGQTEVCSAPNVVEPPQADGEEKTAASDYNKDDDLGSLESKLSNKTESPRRNIPKKMDHREESVSNKSTVWGSLKSLAEGIINYWKNV